MSDRGPSLRTGCQAVTDASRRRRLRPTPPSGRPQPRRRPTPHLIGRSRVPFGTGNQDATVSCPSIESGERLVCFPSRVQQPDQHPSQAGPSAKTARCAVMRGMPRHAPISSLAAAGRSTASASGTALINLRDLIDAGASGPPPTTRFLYLASQLGPAVRSAWPTSRRTIREVRCRGYCGAGQQRRGWTDTVG
jgi:hypothetical protein